MSRQEELEYRRKCPYDAMGDFSVFHEGEAGNPDKDSGKEQADKEAPITD